MFRAAAHIADLPSLLGPLLAKELLVTSRRKRYYVLRSVYAALLALFILSVWIGVVERSSAWSGAYRQAQMVSLGKQVSSYLMWFQFIGSQLVAVVLLSGAISEEIHQRTLLPILTTPLPHWKIVAGKFAGKLAHVGLLLGISLPLLGLARILGGVPWDFVLAGVCISATASMLIGAVATFFSVLCRRPLLAILATIGVAATAYLLIGGILAIVAGILQAVSGTSAMSLALYPNPFAAMIYETVALNDPSQRVASFFWPAHCAVMAGLTFLVLWLTAVVVRRSGLRRALGPVNFGAVADSAGGPPVLAAVEDDADAQPVRRRWRPKGWALMELRRCPVMWREFRKPLLRDRIVQIVVFCAVLFYLLYVYAIFGAGGALGQPATQAGFTSVFLVVLMFCAAADSATTISPEKQTRTLVGLLCTPLSDWDVLMGKACGSLFRCLPVGLLLAGHVTIFVMAGVLHPLAWVQIGMIAVSTTLFLAGTGVYFSARQRRTTMAVLANLGLALVLWVVAPAVTEIVGKAFGRGAASDLLTRSNPVAQTAIVAYGATGHGKLSYGWPGHSAGAGYTTLLVLATSSAYTAAGVLAAWRAKVQMRRKAFDT
jgi:ABC-type transport system involved in multi-copper enzyme maturation permease subunit